MKRLGLFVIVMLAVCAAPAYSQDVRYDFDKDKNRFTSPLNIL
jgi:hypothetical protein